MHGLRGSGWWLVALALGASAAGGRKASALALPSPGNPSVAAAPGWLSFNDLLALAQSVGFSPAAANVAARIAWRESRGNPGATRIVTPAQAPTLGQLPERSFGLWQVNTVDAKGTPIRTDEAQLLDPGYNARVAFELSKGGTSWRPWNLH